VTSFIRETGRDRYFEALERELGELIDPDTGMLSERFARHVACPGCGADRPRRLFEKRGFTFVRCEECSLVYANPQVDESLALREYRGAASSDLWIDVLTSPRQLELDREKFSEILDELEPFRGGGRLLDVGCSIGLFLDLALRRGWEGSGIEFGERALVYAREELALDVTDQPLAEAGIEPESLDVVTLLSVLEHVHEPRRMLADVARVLKPGGALFLIVPNLASLACRILHEHAATFDGRNHLVYYTPATLADLLRRCGYEPELVTTKVTSLDPILEWLTFEEPYSDADTSGDRLAGWAAAPERRAQLEALFEELQLGYKLHMLARRTG
jgi:2-polyprenyl-3-methyl-5-hydroxy-6-metoxy-1,4-benzoquinol methylase